MTLDALHFGPHPIVPRFPSSLPEAAEAAAVALARKIQAAEPLLDSTDVFGKGVGTGLADRPSLHIHDVDRAFQGGSPVMREHRALFLARGDDLVLLGKPSEDFVKYCREDLRLGRVEVLSPRPSRRPRHLAFRALHDAELRGRVERVARIAGGLNVVPYQATGGVWALAGRIATSAGVPVDVGGPPPRLCSAVNDKIWFTRQVARLLGARHLPPTTSASSWVHLAEKVRRIARTHGKVAIKLPSAAGSAGNLVLDSSEIRAFASLAALRTHLVDLFTGLGWTHPFPTLVSVWEESVLLSPSLQAWIPRIEDGPPILEGVFDQSVTGPRGRFVGCAPSTLPAEQQERIACEGALILRLFQELGWYGRCSLDTILVGSQLAEAELHWVECNGRWGGTSIPMTLVNRLAGGWAHRPFVTAGGLLPEGRQRFHQLRERARSRLFDPDVGGGLVFLSPGPRETGVGFAVLSVGRSMPEAREELSHFLGDLPWVPADRRPWVEAERRGRPTVATPSTLGPHPAGR